MQTKLSKNELNQIRTALSRFTPCGFRPFFISFYEGEDKTSAEWDTLDAMMTALEKFPKTPYATYGVCVDGDTETIFIR